MRPHEKSLKKVRGKKIVSGAALHLGFGIFFAEVTSYLPSLLLTHYHSP